MTAGGPTTQYVTAIVGGQVFAASILRVQDVFIPERMTPVPLASGDVVGLLNLRGRIVTMIDMRRRLGLPPRPPEERSIALHIDCAGESYGLLVDSVGEVLTFSDHEREPHPVNLDKFFAAVSAGVHRLDNKLVVVLDVDAVLSIGSQKAA
jgi:purine-binding chemotaxis protein CheW